MTDRELLEMAARAVGHRITWGEKYRVGDDEVDCTDLPYVTSDSPDESPCCWNPLTDDGDALRLAVKLRMGLDTLGLRSDRTHAHVAGMVGVVEVPHDGDPYAATRRAIVRAAAEIGKAMP